MDGLSNQSRIFVILATNVELKDTNTTVILEVCRRRALLRFLQMYFFGPSSFSMKTKFIWPRILLFAECSASDFSAMIGEPYSPPLHILLGPRSHL